MTMEGNDKQALFWALHQTVSSAVQRDVTSERRRLDSAYQVFTNFPVVA